MGEQLRAHEGCPFRLDIIEDTTKAALTQRRGHDDDGQLPR